MAKEQIPQKIITENDPETMDEMYERIRVESMTEQQQAIYIAHKLDQFNAIPPIYERKASI